MINNKKRILIFWILAFLWGSLIFNLSSQPATHSNQLSKGIAQIIVQTVEKIMPAWAFDIDQFNHFLRKSAHFLAYLTLGVIVISALRSSGYESIGLAILICLLYAILDEIHQLFVPGRGGQIRDVIIDSTGAAVGIGLYLILSRRKKTNGKRGEV